MAIGGFLRQKVLGSHLGVHSEVLWIKDQPTGTESKNLQVYLSTFLSKTPTHVWCNH